MGMHNYQFHIDAAFFAEFESSEIENCNVQVDIELNKEPSMLVLNFDLDGSVNLLCDRCADDFHLSVCGNNRLIVKYGEDGYEQTDEVVVLKSDEGKFDLSQYIYEFIHLQLPQKRIHAEGECNPIAIEKLNELNVNTASDKVDPRWEALKGINLKA